MSELEERWITYDNFMGIMELFETYKKAKQHEVYLRNKSSEEGRSSSIQIFYIAKIKTVGWWEENQINPVLEGDDWFDYGSDQQQYYWKMRVEGKA